MAIQTALPSRTADSTAVATPSRADSYLSAFVVPTGNGMHAFGQEGSYFSATNATVGTPITGHAAPVVADTDTKPFLWLFNPGPKSVIMDFAYFVVNGIGTNGTINYVVVYVDNKGSTALSSAGGTTITALNNSNSGSSLASAVTMAAGATVLAMTTSRKIVSQKVREVIPAIGDTIMLKFGDCAAAPLSAQVASGTAPLDRYIPCPPTVIAPGGNLNISFIRPSQTVAATYEFQVGWIEK